jgi:8-oxo-dGTP pyrophosphatase MutT (NUDIX family)
VLYTHRPEQTVIQLTSITS